MATQLGVGHQRSLYADEFCFLVQQRRQLINVQLSSAAAVVEPVVPPLHVVVHSHRRLEGGPGMRWSQPAIQPRVAHVGDDVLDAVVYVWNVHEARPNILDCSSIFRGNPPHRALQIYSCL